MEVKFSRLLSRLGLFRLSLSAKFADFVVEHGWCRFLDLTCSMKTLQKLYDQIYSTTTHFHVFKKRFPESEDFFYIW